MGQLRIVDYEKYCQFCKFKNVDDIKGENPCNDCLDQPVNDDSIKPIDFELDTDKFTEDDLKECETNEQ